MKNLVKLVLIFAVACIVITGDRVFAQSPQSLTVVTIYNTTTCPSFGWAHAIHPELGDANPGSYGGFGYLNAYISWDQPLPGVQLTFFYCRSNTVPAGNNAPYEAYYCYDSDEALLGYGNPPNVTLFPTPRLIWEIDDPE